MRGLSSTIMGICLLYAQAVSAQIIPTSTTTNVSDANCGGLKLVAAAGIPSGQAREYKFHGICKILWVYPKTGSFAGYEWDKDTKIEEVASVWADVALSWNSQTGYMKEVTKTQFPYAGQISMELRCADDPVLTSVGCKGLSYTNTTGWGGFDRVYTVPRPLSRGKTTLAEASALSQQTASGPSTPPAPPPAPTSPIQRLPVPTGTEPVAIATPQMQVAPTRSSPSPGPSSPPESSGEIPLEPAVRVELQDGRAIVADGAEGALRWTIVGPKGQLMRRFPAGAKLSEHGHGHLTLKWPGGSYAAGKRKPEKSAGKKTSTSKENDS